MPVIFTTEATPASEMLKILIDKHKSLAAVLDEKGNTSGIIAIEDIIEEIIGDIEDESDVDETTEYLISENEYIFSGMLEIEYLNNKYGFQFPEGVLTRIPSGGCCCTYTIPYRNRGKS